MVMDCTGEVYSAADAREAVAASRLQFLAQSFDQFRLVRRAIAAFPEIRLQIESAVDYLNEHGGMGGRPIELQSCVAKGSPETSQACAQELVGKNVELVMLGLDLFPDYATYTAAGYA